MDVPFIKGVIMDTQIGWVFRKKEDTKLWTFTQHFHVAQQIKDRPEYEIKEVYIKDKENVDSSQAA
jgi:uncharacterized protein YhbP (UPF0306 family)